MANNQRVTQWILDNSSALNLRVLNLDWIHRFFPGYFDFQVTITIDHETYTGRGSDSDSNTALIKAVCEAIERSVCQDNGVSSMGVAGHMDLDLAKENALLEHTERYVLGLHFKNQVAMRSISNELVQIKPKGFDFVNFELIQYEMRVPDSYYGVFTMANGLKLDRKFGGIMGIAVSKNKAEAATKSKIECLRNLLALEIEPMTSLTFDEFKSIKSPSARDSQKLLFNANYCQNLLAIFSGDNFNTDAFGFRLKDLKFDQLISKSSALTSCPFVFVRCIASDDLNFNDLEFVG